jgi:hypothetical protein
MRSTGRHAPCRMRLKVVNSGGLRSREIHLGARIAHGSGDGLTRGRRSYRHLFIPKPRATSRVRFGHPEIKQ